MEIRLIKKEYYDIIVVGGGIAGIASAVSAARCGSKVLLLEKQFNLGGLATGGLISWYEPLCDGLGKQVIGGIGEELIKLCTKYSFDSLPKEWGGTEKSAPRKPRYATRYSPTVFSLALDEYVLSYGIDVLFDTYATYPVMEGNKVTGVIVENSDGRQLFETNKVIDATGDALIMKRAGVPCRTGKNYMTYITHVIDNSVIDEYKEKGYTWKLRDWQNAGSDMLGVGHPEGMKMLEDPTAEELTQYMLIGKQRMLEKIKRKDKYSYDIMSIPTMPQLRTIRQIVGDSDFEGIPGKKYPDSIGQVPDFRDDKIGNLYEIPRGALYNSQFKGLYAAGRIISAPTFDGWEVARVIPVCALIGEVVGEIATKGANN